MLLLCLDVLAYGFRMRPTHGKDRGNVLAPRFRGANPICDLTGGLHFVATSDYSLATILVAAPMLQTEAFGFLICPFRDKFKVRKGLTSDRVRAS